MRRLHVVARAASIAAFLISLPTSSEVEAHPLTFTDTTLTLSRDGTFQVDLLYDLDALALGAPLNTDDADLVAALEQLSPSDFDTRVEQLQRLFARRVRVRFDGEPAPFDVTFPDYGTSSATDAAIPTVLGLTARLTGSIPDDATTVEFFASRAFADVHLTIIDAARDLEFRTVLERGARSDPYEFTAPPASPSHGETATQYLRLGFTHIVPNGLDHILFVLGLFLLSARLRPLVWQVTAFTLAHAITLTAAALGTVMLSARLVEPLIAVSVVYVAVENLFTDRLTPWRPTVVFAFGLLHGLGFAGALGVLGLPNNEWLFALVTFNAGIELGQLAVLVVAAASVGWFRKRSWYRQRIVVPASSVIALVGMVWAIERALGF